jgi:hypothetical protein
MRAGLLTTPVEGTGDGLAEALSAVDAFDQVLAAARIALLGAGQHSAPTHPVPTLRSRALAKTVDV